MHHRKDLTYIEESWGILPNSLSVVDTISGQKLYSSDKIKEKFLSALEHQKILSPVIEKVNNLIERQIIIPCFASRTLIDLLQHKFFSDRMSRSILGVYVPEKNRIYIVLDNHTKYIVFMSDKALSSVTIHELQHYAARNLKMGFFDLCKDSMRTYFSYFYNLYFGMRIDGKTIDEIVEFCYVNFELKTKTSTKFLSDLAKLMSKLFGEDDNTDILIKRLLSVAKLYLSNPNSFIMLAISGHEQVINVITSLHKSYKSLDINDPHTLAIQELVFPSEIISIQSQNKPSELHYKIIRSL